MPVDGWRKLAGGLLWAAGIALVSLSQMLPAHLTVPLAAGVFAAAATVTVCIEVRSQGRGTRRAIYHHQRWGGRVPDFTVPDNVSQLRSRP